MRQGHRQAGLTLIETMVTLVLVSVIVLTMLSAFSSTALATARHQQQTSLDRLVRSDAEFIKSQAYVPKPGAYTNLTVAGYTFTTTVLYYDPVSQTFSAASTERGLQQITLVATAPSGGRETLIFLKARP
jgi:prepilin-type N-terminal cleavage/methylation domain-containing protein